MNKMYKYQWYQRIFDVTPKILEEARAAAEKMGLERLRGRVGLSPASSTCPGPLPKFVLRAIEEANEIPVLPIRKVEDELRELAKDIYGDEYDVVMTNTCEAGLRVAYETLFAPPTMRSGEAYRARFLTPYGEDYEFTAGYGRPFPPKYKGVMVDRSSSAGELSVEGKSLTNLDAVFVRLVGARYDAHGIKFNPVPLLSQIDHRKSYERFEQAASRHAAELVGITTVMYDSPGYGGNEKDDKGVPKLMKMLGQLAREYDVPFIVDTAASAPVLSPSPSEVGAHIMLWSTDKVIRAPIGGLMVGEEEIMVPIRKALGLGGERYGELSSHTKARFSHSDPGRDAVVGLIAVLKALRDNPDLFKKPIDQMYAIVKEEFAQFEFDRFLKDMIITKSYALGGIEINYEQTWNHGEFGIPIFSAEDSFANTNPIMAALAEMGVNPALVYSANMTLGPGTGTVDPEGNLMVEPTRLAVRALVRATEIVCDRAGLSR